MENIVPDTIGIVKKKTNYDAKTKYVVDKLPKRDEFVTTPEFNKFSSTIFDE